MVAKGRIVRGALWVIARIPVITGFIPAALPPLIVIAGRLEFDNEGW